MNHNPFPQTGVLLDECDTTDELFIASRGVVSQRQETVCNLVLGVVFFFSLVN